MFDPVPRELDFPAAERRILEFWKKHQVFEKSLKWREGQPEFVFYEGPPTANGTPHNGHVFTRVIKDLFPRYKTMRGCHVVRKAGWDTHGLPVEVEVSKELGLHGKDEIEAYGLDRFNRKCIESVFRYIEDWEKLTERIGFWIDLSQAYVTYHKEYVESVWWALKTLFERGLLYQDYKIVWWWAQGGTALSSGEVGLGYKEVADPSVYVKCPITGPDNKIASLVQGTGFSDRSISLLVWTTTPWTLPDNMYIAAHKDFDYALVEDEETQELLIVAESIVSSLEKKLGKRFAKRRVFKGEELNNLRYKPPFTEHYRQYTFDYGKEEEYCYWRVVASPTTSSFVTLETGTGLVHIAPAYGEDDYNLYDGLRSVNVETMEHYQLFCSVRPDGTFGPEFELCAGRWVKDADPILLDDLKKRGLLYHREQYVHNYPFCYRSMDDPLLQYPRKSWFIRTQANKDRAIENNRAVTWLPEHIQEGRFGDFLRNNVDWALSRERFWGTPLPIWVCEKCGKRRAVASVAEIERLNPHAFDHFRARQKEDPTLSEHLMVHKPWIDEVTLPCQSCGGDMRRVPEVIDCWFDAGAMPFAQWGFPHRGREEFRRQFPADFISEAIDQTRGWFYALMMISTLLGEALATAAGLEGMKYPHPYRHCVVLGHVCDLEGKKESKSEGNYTPPGLVLEGCFELSVEVEASFAPSVLPHPASAPQVEKQAGRGRLSPGTCGLREAQIKTLGLGEKEKLTFRKEPGAAATLELSPRAAPVRKESVLLTPADAEALSLKAGDKVWIYVPGPAAGADAFRWFFYASSPPWNNTRNSLRNIRAEQKEFLIKLRELHRFFAIYAPIDGFNPAEGNPQARGVDPEDLAPGRGYRPAPERARLDRWMISEVHLTAREIVRLMDAYQLYEAARLLVGLVDAASNWYLRRSRARFWKTELDQDKLDAYWTLYETLLTISRLAAPFVPFMAEEIYQNLARRPWPESVPLSVHLTDYPTGEEALIDAELSAHMSLVREIASLGLAARAGRKVKVRQPLREAKVILADSALAEKLREFAPVLAEELNVREISFLERADQYVSYVLKPDFSKIGPRLGPLAPRIKEALARADAAALREERERRGKIALDLDGEKIELEAGEVQVDLAAKEGYAAAGGRRAVVVLDIALDAELVSLGRARELVSRLQNLRKELDLDYTARVRLSVTGSATLAEVCREHHQYIAGETLCTELRTTGELEGEKVVRREMTLDGEKVTVRLLTV